MYKPIITFEGIDGSGKSTQAALLVDKIKKRSDNIVLLHEPRILRTEIFDYIAKNKNNVNDAYVSYLFCVDGEKCRKEEIKVYQDYTIVRDRDTTFSQYAYHHNLGTCDEMIFGMSHLINAINSVDIIFFVDIDPDIAIARIKARSPNKEIVDYFEKEEKLKKIYANYHEMLESKDILSKMGILRTGMDGRQRPLIFIIDGNRSIDEVSQDIFYRAYDFI